MLSASYWSLLLPAVELSSGRKLPVWFPLVVGFLAGGFFLRVLDKLVPHLHLYLPTEKAEGVKSSLKKTTLLILAITIHNFPEGLAIGVASGSDFPYHRNSHSEFPGRFGCITSVKKGRFFPL